MGPLAFGKTGSNDIANDDVDGWRPNVVTPTRTFQDVGGIESILQDIREVVEYPLRHPEIYEHM